MQLRQSPARAIPRRWDFFPYALVAPLILLEIGLVAVPLAIGAYYSVHRVTFFQLREFTGLQNYVRVLTSPEVIQSVSVTLAFTALSLIFTFAVGFALAMYLERDTRYNVGLRAVVLIPHVISILVGSLLVRWLFSQDGGILPLVLQPFGLADLSVLGDPRRAMGALVFNAVWRDSAFATILLLAGLKGIPGELYAAARIDGASAWYQFRRLTLPLLRIPIFITIVRLVIHFVNVITYSLVLTGGGPGKSTSPVALELYRLGFERFQFGQANALAMLVVMFNIILVYAIVRLFRGSIS
jgi:ABC-type sugar transport system permease subunit